MKKIFVVFLIIMFLISCKTFKDHVFDISKEEGYTVEQSSVIYHSILVKEMMESKKDGSRKINYSSMDIKDVESQIDSMLEDIDYLLDPKIESIQRRYKQYPHMKEEIEKNERIIKFLKDRLVHVRLNRKFNILMAGGKNDTPFKPEYLNPINDLENDLKYSARYVEKAEEEGELNIVEDFVINYHYKKREQDEKFPDDINKKIIVDKSIELRIAGYDAGNDGVADYVEICRLRDNYPITRIFKSINSEMLDICVIDTDVLSDSTDNFGLGIPDIVEKIYGIDGEQVAMKIFKKQDLINKIFEQKKKKKRIVPEIIENKMMAVLAGKTSIEEYEINEKGWQIPIRYCNGECDNYIIEILYGKNDNKKVVVDYFVKKFHSASSKYSAVRGKVVEYYKPKFDQDKDIESIKLNKNKLIVDFKGELTKVGMIDLFIRKKPKVIEYSDGNNSWDNRWRLVDEDSDGIYEKRKKIANNYMYSYSSGTLPEYEY